MEDTMKWKAEGDLTYMLLEVNMNNCKLKGFEFISKILFMF